MKNRVLALKRMILVITLLCTIVFFTSCTARKMKDYYSQKDNYITATGTISHIAYSDGKDILYYGFSNVTYPSNMNYHFEYYNFKIVGENFQILHEQNIDEKVKMGDEVTFIAAPEYFYDGYAIPIVSISVNGECLLEFEEGYANLLEWLKTTPIY